MTTQELNKFNSFLLQLIRLTSNRIVRPLYRGERLSILCEKLGVPNSPDKSSRIDLLERLFMIGDKSKSYFSKEYFGINRSWNIGVNECNEHILNTIFDATCDCIKKCKSTQVQDFFRRNAVFSKYFSNRTANKKEFANTVLSFDSDKQLFFRNYYLKLLHQIGSINIRKRSIFTSTSTDYSIAKQFAGSRDKSDRAIIHAWEPVYYSNRKLAKSNLPKYSGRPYRDQKEVSMLAGIFPHYIIGLEIPDEKQFYINQSLFSNKIHSNIFVDGFRIDQSNFEATIRSTNYSRYFVADGNKFADFND